MIQSGGILDELLVGLRYELFKVGTKALSKKSPEINKDATRYFLNKRINKLKELRYVKVQ